jgi:hypothetical protein
VLKARASVDSECRRKEQTTAKADAVGVRGSEMSVWRVMVVRESQERSESEQGQARANWALQAPFSHLPYSEALLPPPASTPQLRLQTQVTDDISNWAPDLKALPRNTSYISPPSVAGNV